MSQLVTAAPAVTLRSAPAAPYDGAIAAARTCYSPRVISRDEVTERQRAAVGPLTFNAGHHTVYQHAHFEFGLEHVSRQFVWSILHAYPFYNSEQSSQRYVQLDEPRVFVPPLSGEAMAVYEAAVLRAWEDYRRLSALLKADTFAILKQLRYVTPRASAARLGAIERAWDDYGRLSALLKDDAFAILKELRYVTPRASEQRLKGIGRVRSSSA
jgi:hypothetical protein